MFQCDSRELWGGVASVRASSQGLLHPKALVWRPGSQERLRCPKSDHGCLDGVKLMLGLHQEYLEVMKLMMGLHHESPRVKFKVGFHQGCFIREQEVSRSGEASDGGFTSKDTRK